MTDHFRYYFVHAVAWLVHRLLIPARKLDQWTDKLVAWVDILPMPEGRGFQQRH